MIKELRIDNLILYGAHGPVLVIEVKKTGKVRVEFLSAQSIEHGYYRKTMDISQFDPIPLTPEWLGTMAVKAEQGLFKFQNTDFYLRVTPEGVDVSIDSLEGLKKHYFRYNILYVHQLQNLYFALTGEELQIKNI